MRALIAAAALALVACQKATPLPNPLVGTWQLNVSRSHYGGGAEPRTSETFVCRAEAVVIACTTTSVRPDGRTVTASFMAPDDGTNGPVQGIAEMDSVKLQRGTSNAIDAVFTLKGVPVYGYHAVRSDDGKQLTIASIDPVTRTWLKSVIVYDAQ